MRRPAAWAVALALVLAAGAAPAVLAPRAVRAEEAPADPVGEAKRLAEEAKEYEKVAGDGDADNAERKNARKNAHERLKKAKDLLDAWLDKHPEDQDRLDQLYCDIASRDFWVKKMAATDEFTDNGPGPGVSKPPPGGPAPGGPSPGTGGPAPGNGGPAPGTGGPAPGPVPAKPKDEPKPEPPTPAKVLAEIEAYGAKHKSDVPGLYERYQDFLAKFPDPSSPEYAKAMAQVADLSKRLKDVYRVIHDDDPDSVKNVDSAQTEKLLTQLLDDLTNDKSPPEVRERAARFLGNLGSGKAADPLIKTMKKEKSGPVFDAAADSLARIGGRRVCERLLKAGGDDQLAPTIVSILEKILARGGAEGRVAGEALGGYAGAIAPENRGPIFESLTAAGPAGALGIARGLEFAPPGDVAKLVEKLPEAGDPRVVTYVSKLMIVNAPGIRGEHSAAARRAVEKIGKPGVRYLIPSLDDATVSVWTAELLKRITGAKPKDDKRKTWEAWFRMNRKAIEGK